MKNALHAANDIAAMRVSTIMKRRDALLALLFLAALSFAIVHSAPGPTPATAAVHRLMRSRMSDVASLRTFAVNDTAFTPQRNLFGYPQREVAHPVAVKETVRERAPDHPAEAILPTQRETLPSFPYRYIGRFGPASLQLAAFAADGEVIVVRAGEKISGAFVLRAIGIESVVIGIIGSEKTITVPL